MSTESRAARLTDPLLDFSSPPLFWREDLFFGSRRGGELACVAYTLIENCKRHGLDLQGYLKQAMQLLVEHGAGRAAEFCGTTVRTTP